MKNFRAIYTTAFAGFCNDDRWHKGCQCPRERRRRYGEGGRGFFRDGDSRCTLCVRHADQYRISVRWLQSESGYAGAVLSEYGPSGERGGEGGLRETGGEEGEEVYDCAARFDDIPVKGINFTGNRSINACFMAPSILSLCPFSLFGCGENAIERLLSATQGSRLLFNCSRPTRADSPAGLNQYTNEESFDYIRPSVAWRFAT